MIMMIVIIIIINEDFIPVPYKHICVALGISHYSTENFVVSFCDHSHWWIKLWSFEKNDYIIIIWFVSLWSKQTWCSLFSRDTVDYGIDSSIFLDQKKNRTIIFQQEMCILRSISNSMIQENSLENFFLKKS